MENNIININNIKSLDNAGKNELDNLITSLSESIKDEDKLSRIIALKKLNYIIDGIIENFKTETKDEYLKTFGGSTKEILNNYEIQLRKNTEYEYSDKLNKKIEKHKEDGKILTAEKNIEKAKGIAKLISEDFILAFKLKDK